ncbi:hypothetical protein NDU88_012090 [Pleurodeles waltl]|uniref:Secreted protein n=1 Tax=Pleurodeles waltl TaxID=8319 RepID=A0AAV7S791_PLEWA|nr:hypothetical protein NDU88_012090 [Pleurodeles waltl]
MSRLGAALCWETLCQSGGTATQPMPQLLPAQGWLFLQPTCADVLWAPGGHWARSPLALSRLYAKLLILKVAQIGWVFSGFGFVAETLDLLEI